MKNKIVDTRGQICPIPLMLTKKALNDISHEETFSVLIDNETAKENIEKFLKDNKINFRSKKTEEGFLINVDKTGKFADGNPEEYCSVPVVTDNTGGHIICIKNNKMGVGPDELGSILIKGFINTIKEVKPLPERIIFYNNGVLLTTKDSQLVDSLKELEESGVIITICGTCADYFNIKEKIAVGAISNMYDISESLIKAAKIIYP
ncbi:MAG: sulfurtransferase-like selenium metabolism protein YedF [Bacteroidota bacterium]